MRMRMRMMMMKCSAEDRRFGSRKCQGERECIANAKGLEDVINGWRARRGGGKWMDRMKMKWVRSRKY
jgi:hypothetical protein